jgi:hypothetical protein
MATATKKEVTFLSAEELLSADDRPEKIVDVPEWGGQVKIKALSLGQFQAIYERAATKNGEVDEQNSTVYWLIEGIIEPKLNLEQASLLRDKNALVVTRVMNEIAEISAATEADIKAAEATFPDGA